MSHEEAKERHLADQEKFKLAIRVLLPLNFKEFIETMDHAEAIGPFFAPSAWQEKHKDLAIDLAAARAIQECVAKLREVYKESPVVQGLVGIQLLQRRDLHDTVAEVVARQID